MIFDQVTPKMSQVSHNSQTSKNGVFLEPSLNAYNVRSRSTEVKVGRGLDVKPPDYMVCRCKNTKKITPS